MNCSNIIVADENIPILVIRGLRARGCDIVSIVEEARGCSDEIVLDISVKRCAGTPNRSRAAGYNYEYKTFYKKLYHYE